MANTSSRAKRNVHPYMVLCQKEADESSDSVNPITIQWDTSKIKRYDKQGVENVEVYRDGILTWSSNPMSYNMNTRDLNPPKDEAVPA